MKNPVILLDEIDKLGVGLDGLARGGAARGARSRAEQDLHRPLPRAPVRSLRGDVHLHGEHLETLSAPLRDRLEIIELSGYTADEKLDIAQKHLVPKQLKEHAIPEGALDHHRRGALRHRPRLHARGRRSPAERGSSRSSAARSRSRSRARQTAKPHELHVDRGGPRTVPRQAPVLQRGGRADQRAGRGDRARLDAGRRRHPLHRDLAHARQGPRRDHRPARRRDEGVGAGRAHLRAEQRRGARRRRRRARSAGPAHPRARGRRPQGRTLGRRHDVHRAHLAPHRTARCARTRR